MRVRVKGKLEEILPLVHMQLEIYLFGMNDF
jgi:hypothetical protein